jgi:hypothetical protein
MSRHSGLHGEEAAALDALGQLQFPGVTDPSQLDVANRKLWMTARGVDMQAIRSVTELTRAGTEDIKRRADLDERRAEQEAEDLRARREADLEDQAQRRRERDDLFKRETTERRDRLDQEIRERETHRKLSVVLIPATVLTVLVTAVLVLGGVLNGVATVVPSAAVISMLAALRLSSVGRFG